MKPEQIAAIAHLARLSMDEAEIPRYQDTLASILSFVGDLERAQTQAAWVERQYQTAAPENRLVTRTLERR